MTDCTHKFIDVKVRGADLGRICNKCGGEQISTTPTDNAELEKEIWGKLKTDPRADTYVIPHRVMDVIVETAQAHIDTVCREAERQGGTDELMEMLDMCLTNYAKTKNNDMKTLADYCNNRLTQLNPNKDTV